MSAGFSALEVLSRNVNVPVHVHRTMHGAMTRDKGHPRGTTTGARAMVQAAEAWMKRGPLSKYAEDHKDLETALKILEIIKILLHILSTPLPVFQKLVSPRSRRRSKD